MSKVLDADFANFCIFFTDEYEENQNVKHLILKILREINFRDLRM